MAEKLISIYPAVAEMMSANRKFVAGAVTWAANQGIDQFIDLGSGLPTAPNTHEAVQAVIPSAQVVYVDNDPVVLSHLNALLAKHGSGVAVLDGDVWQPKAIMSHPVVTRHADLTRPVCAIMAMLPHFIDAPTAHTGA